METCCEYTDSVMWVSTDERRMITRMMKLIAEHPDETEIIKRPEENDGCLYCKVPATWLKIPDAVLKIDPVRRFRGIGGYFLVRRWNALQGSKIRRGSAD